VVYSAEIHQLFAPRIHTSDTGFRGLYYGGPPRTGPCSVGGATGSVDPPLFRVRAAYSKKWGVRGPHAAFDPPLFVSAIPTLTLTFRYPSRFLGPCSVT